MTFLSQKAAVGKLPGSIHAGSSYLTMVASCLDFLIEIGFDRARFYFIDLDPHLPEPVESLFLVAMSAGHADDVSPGYAISLRDSTFGQASTGDSTFFPVVESDFGDLAGSIEHPWMGVLDLAGRTWIDIPIHDGSRLTGLLAADWVGPPSELKHQDLLSVYGRVVGALLQNAPHELSLTISTAVASLIEHIPSEPDSAAKAILDLLYDLLECGSAALFKYNLSSNALDRIHFRSPKDWHDDETYQVGEKLTGIAWDDSYGQYREVVNFDTIRDHHPDLVARSSVDWHDENLERVQSVAYVKLGEREPRYLLRFVNKADQPTLPFTSEFAALRQATPELALLVDNVIADRRALAGALLSPYLSDYRSTPETADALLNALEVSESLGPVLVLMERGKSAGFTHVGSKNLQLSASYLRNDVGSADELYSVSSDADSIRLIPLRSSTRHDGSKRNRTLRSLSTLGHDLYAMGFQSVLAVPLGCGTTRGALLFPTKFGSEQAIEDLISNGTAQALRHYATLLATTAESAYLAQQGTEAMRALGLVGHELAIPVATLASLGEESLVGMRSVVRDLRGSLGEPDSSERLLKAHDWNVRGILQKYIDVRGQVSSALSLASIVSKDSGGYLACEPREVPVQSLVNAAVRQARQEEFEYVACEFAVSGEIRSMGAVVCDGRFVHHCLLNLLRNAAKYSLERRSGQRPVIEVSGQLLGSGPFLEIDVRNWGRPIPAERRPVIFEAFVRGLPGEPKLAQRGMGLGLFLARRIAVAHGGDVLLHRSSQAGDVSDTVFRLRIPTDIAVQGYAYDFDSALGKNQVPRR